MYRNKRLCLFAVALLALVAADSAFAQSVYDEPESPLHALARGIGLSADPGKPEEFVRESRPAAPTEPIPVFAPTNEPTSQVRSPDSLKTMDADLDAVVKAHERVRASAGVIDGPPLAASTKATAKKPKAKKPKDASSASN